VPSQLDEIAAGKIEYETVRPESASYITPPTIPALPVAGVPTEKRAADRKTPPLPPPVTAMEKAPGTTGGSLINSLRIDVSYTPSMAAMPSPTTEAACGIPPSPGPMLTPGAPPSVPVELRAAAAERLWPLLAPFAPHMLRDDILMPPSKRRFVQSNINLTKDSNDSTTAVSSLSTLPPEAQPNLQQGLSLDLDRNHDAFAQHHTHSHHSHIPSAWHLDTEMKAASSSFQAAIAIADISGFTSLTEALTRTGPGGVELLTRCMNSYFAQVIDLVTLYGGDVSKFAGDAMLIVFAPTKEEIAAAAANKNDADDGGLGAATRRAAVAAKELVDKFGVMSMLSTGEAIAVPRTQVKRQGSKFVRQPSNTGTADVGSGIAPEEGLLRRGASFGLQTADSLNRGAAKTGRIVSQTAAYVGTVPVEAGSKALSGPLRMINSGINYFELPRSNTSGGSNNSRNRNRKKIPNPSKGGEEKRKLWMDWREEDQEDGGGREGSSKKKKNRAKGSTSLRTTIIKSRSESDILDLAKEADVVDRVRPAPAGATVAPAEDDTSGEEKQQDAEEQAQIIRAIHQETLTALAEAFVGGTLLQVRPPPLPVRSFSEEEREEAERLTPIETATAAAAAPGGAGGLLTSSRNTRMQQPPRPKSAPGTLYNTTYADSQDFVDNTNNSLSIQRMSSDASAAGATPSSTSNANSMALRNGNNSFGSFTNIGGAGYDNARDRGPIELRLPSVSEREVGGDGGGGGGEVAWPHTVRKLVSRAFRFGPSKEANDDTSHSSLHTTRMNSVDEAVAGGGSAFRLQGSTNSSTTTSQSHHPKHQTQRNNSAFIGYPSSIHSATSRDGGGSSFQGFPKEDFKLRVLHPTASWSAPTSPQNSPPESPRSSAYGGGQDIPGPAQSSFSFGAGGLGYRGYSTTTTGGTPDEVLPPLTGQDSAPLNLVTGGLPDDLLSLKVTLAAGTLCAYRVGGVMEPTTEGCPEAARWEFFVADADDEEGHQENIEKEKEKGGFSKSSTSSGDGNTPTDIVDVGNKEITYRGPIKQLKETECHAIAGNVVVSKEVADLVACDAELLKFSDGAAELIAMTENARGKQMRSRPGLKSKMMTECIRLSSLTPQERVDAYQVSTESYAISYLLNYVFTFFMFLCRF